MLEIHDGFSRMRWRNETGTRREREPRTIGSNAGRMDAGRLDRGGVQRCERGTRREREKKAKKDEA